ncbi:protein IQ-DOMAIN 2-like [Bidens hawaiensis]|uniref:protein IQ-DOMAIN 2-like n=1 Tax=Bidens hawaiensis TaxID=980011 RepID=UPI00404B48AF
MVKKGNWLSSIKKTLSPSSKQKKSQKSEHPSVPSTSVVENVGSSGGSRSFPPPEEVTPLVVEAEPPQAASGAPAAVSAAAGAAVKARYSGISREEAAAVRIQTVFRGYLARRALWGLRGLVRLKAVVDGPSVKRQTANTLKFTRSLSHLQYQISSRRIRMLEENQARQKQLQLAKEMANFQNGDDWNDSVQSKEEVEAKLLSKYEATMRRERAMAYSFSHQRPWKKAVGTTNMLFMDPANPQRGWSWSERYYKEPVTDHASVKTGINITRSEIAKSYARHQLNSAPTTPLSKGGGGSPVASRKPKPKPGLSPRAFGYGPEGIVDDDAKSVTSVKSERNGYRRRSVGSTVAAKSAKGKTQTENGGAKKQLSFPAKPKRHSGPPKVDTSLFNRLEHTSAK